MGRYRRFEARTALITGGGTGIGKAVGLALAAEGAHVVVIGRREEPLRAVVSEIVAAGGSAVECAGDVRDADDVKRAIDLAAQRSGGIDVLVTSAGVAMERDFLDLSLEDWHAVMSINLDGMFVVGQAVAQKQVSQGKPLSIVNIGSMNAFGIDGPYAAYHTSKHAVLGLTRSMAVELGPRNVRVNCVSPGYTNTELDEWPPNVKAHLLTDFKRAPLRRMVEPAEVAAAVLFLASDDASGISGSSLSVDGGLTASHHAYETLPLSH